MRVLNSKILVTEKNEDKTESGLIVASSSKDYSKPVEAVVEGVGDEVKTVKVNDVILYMPRAGVAFDKDDVTYRILKEDEVLAIL